MTCSSVDLEPGLETRTLALNSLPDCKNIAF